VPVFITRGLSIENETVKCYNEEVWIPVSPHAQIESNFEIKVDVFAITKT